jgi:hypothetical protein
MIFKMFCLLLVLLKISLCLCQGKTKSILKYLTLGVSTVETNRDQDFSTRRDQLLKVSRFILTFETGFWKCWDRESRSRPRRDKSRPPGLKISDIVLEKNVSKCVCHLFLSFLNSVSAFVKLIPTRNKKCGTYKVCRSLNLICSQTQ